MMHCARRDHGIETRCRCEVVRVLVVLGLATLCGCGIRTAQKDSQFGDTRKLSASWQQFIGKAKARESLANANFQKRKHQGTKFEVEWIENDVKKTESIMSPVVGKVKVRAHTYTDLGNHFVHDYDLEFVPANGDWTFNKGTIQMRNTTYADREPRPYGALKDEIGVLFSE
jgi:hypothetical protein